MRSDELVERAHTARTDADRWAVVRNAWEVYVYEGAGAFDWDFDSRDLMDALVASSRSSSHGAAAGAPQPQQEGT